MRLNLLCNADASDVENIRIDDINFANDIGVVSMRSKHACYIFSLNAFFTYISEYGYLFGAIMIVVGLGVAFLGKKLVKPTIFVIGSLASISILGVFIFGLSFSQNSSETVKWVVFGVICVVGLAVGLLLAYLARIGAALLSAWGGVVLGMILYTAFIVRIDNEQQVGYWVTLVLMGVIAGIVGYFMYNHAIIIATGLIGSYLFIRGISLYAGGYPNEALIVEKISNGLVTDFPASFYGYFAGFIVLTIVSIVFQYKMWYGKTKDSLYDHPYHKYRN